MSKQLHAAIAQAARMAKGNNSRYDVWQHPDDATKVHVCPSNSWYWEMRTGELDAYELIGSATPTTWESNV